MAHFQSEGEDMSDYEEWGKREHDVEVQMDGSIFRIQGKEV